MSNIVKFSTRANRYYSILPSGMWQFISNAAGAASLLAALTDRFSKTLARGFAEAINASSMSVSAGRALRSAQVFGFAGGPSVGAVSSNSAAARRVAKSTVQWGFSK